jgi:epoxyqueuosine reductase
MYRSLETPRDWTEHMTELLMTQGVPLVGVSTRETLAGGPPSTDLEYVLPGAKSAITFAVPLDENKIELYLSKQDHAGHQDDNTHTNAYVSGLAVQGAAFLDHRGHPSYGCCANAVYRKDTPNGINDFMPDISHRYLAVRSGIGWFGFSGNVITKDYGAAVILGSVVTTVEMEPTEPLPPEDKYCDDCKLCLASCNSGLMEKKEQTTVTMGGIDFSYSKRKTYRRCDLVCGGFTGLSKNGKWSTWSPGRFEIPASDDEFTPVLVETVVASAPRPLLPGGFHHPVMPGRRKINFTCGNCQLLCHPDKDERNRRYKLLTESGVVIQHADGSLEAVAPKIAEKYVSELPDDQRAMYEKV